MGKCHLGFSNCSHVTFFSISSTLQLNCSWSAKVLYSMECTLEARTPAELRPLCLPLSLLAFATLLMRLLRLNFFFSIPKADVLLMIDLGLKLFSILASLLWLEDEANMQSWFWRHTEFFYPKNVGIAQWANITKNDTSKARQLFGFIFWETILNLESLYYANVPAISIRIIIKEKYRLTSNY